MHDAMRSADPSGGLEKCWQGKEMLRQLLALAGSNPTQARSGTTDRRPLRRLRNRAAPPARLDGVRVATIDHQGLRTGISNGRTEGYNRM